MNSLLMRNEELVKVLIITDTEIVRKGLSAGIMENTRFSVESSGIAIPEFLEHIQAFNPQIVLLDAIYPLIDTELIVKAIKERHSDSKIVVIASCLVESDIINAVCSGVDAYCMRSITITRLHQVLEMVAEGALWFDPLVSPIIKSKICTTLHLTDYCLSRGVQEEVRVKPRFTKREYEILSLLVNGDSNQKIAQELSISPHTVKLYVSKIFRKLSVSDRFEASRKAISEDLLKDSVTQ